MTIRTWGIGGEAEDDEGSARLLTHLAVGGRTGVLGPLDCRVLPLTTPGSGFRVTVGAMSLAVPAKPRQKYGVEIDTEETVTDLQGTGPGSGRHDLVLLRTDNPNLPGGGQLPADPRRGPYSTIEVIQGVPFGTKSFAQLGYLYAGEELARLEYPPSTATIGGATGNARIVDLRLDEPAATPVAPPTTNTPTPTTGSTTPGGKDPVAAPPAASAQTVNELRSPNYGAAGNSDLTASAWSVWPPAPAGTAVFPVEVPSWARSLTYKATIDNLLSLNGDVTGEIAVVTDGAGASTLSSRPFRHEWAGQPNTVKCMTAGSRVPVAAGLRGRRVNFMVMARRSVGPGYLRFQPGMSVVELWIHFHP